MKTFELEIINPEKVVFKGRAKSLVLPAYEGKMGVLAGHAHMVAQLTPGEVKVELEQAASGGSVIYFSVSGGFAAIDQKKTQLFVEAAEDAEDVNEQRALLALERAKDQVKQKIEIEKAQAAIQRALARLRVVEKARHHKHYSPEILAGKS